MELDVLVPDIPYSVQSTDTVSVGGSLRRQLWFGDYICKISVNDDNRISYLV